MITEKTSDTSNVLHAQYVRILCNFAKKWLEGCVIAHGENVDQVSLLGKVLSVAQSQDAPWTTQTLLTSLSASPWTRTAVQTPHCYWAIRLELDGGERLEAIASHPRVPSCATRWALLWCRCASSEQWQTPTTSQPVNIVLDLEQCSLLCRIALGLIQFRWSSLSVT